MYDCTQYGRNASLVSEGGRDDVQRKHQQRIHDGGAIGMKRMRACCSAALPAAHNLGVFGVRGAGVQLSFCSLLSADCGPTSGALLELLHW